MKRADRRRLAEALARPEAQLIITHVMAHAMRVLRKDFGFGDVRIKRFVEGMMEDTDAHSRT